MFRQVFANHVQQVLQIQVSAKLVVSAKRFGETSFRRNLYCFARFHKYFLCSFTFVSQGSQGFTNMSFASLQFSVSQEFANRFFVSQVLQGFAMGSLLMIILEQQMITLPALQLV